MSVNEIRYHSYIEIRMSEFLLLIQISILIWTPISTEKMKNINNSKFYKIKLEIPNK